MLPRIVSEKRLALRKRLIRLARPARLGTLRRTSPISDAWGFDRGTPVDRYYIERFLQEHAADIRGHVLEVKDSSYTTRFGRGVDRCDVLDIDAANPHATLIADLADAGSIPSNAFDCFVLTQTLQLIYETHAAIAHAHRMLRPGGTLLVTVPAMSRIVRRDPDYWRFTPASCSRLFEETFGAGGVTITAYGNVLTGIAFLSGMAAEELSHQELEAEDANFPLIIAIRAVKG